MLNGKTTAAVLAGAVAALGVSGAAIGSAQSSHVMKHPAAMHHSAAMTHSGAAMAHPSGAAMASATTAG